MKKKGLLVICHLVEFCHLLLLYITTWMLTVFRINSWSILIFCSLHKAPPSNTQFLSCMGPNQWCANPNPDSRLFELDSDSDSDLKNMNPDSDSRKKGVDSSPDSNPDSNFWVPITPYWINLDLTIYSQISSSKSNSWININDKIVHGKCAHFVKFSYIVDKRFLCTSWNLTMSINRLP